jgi:hypothetical protein
MRVLTIAAAAVLVSATAFAQDEPARRAAVEVAARVPLEKAIKGAPYSAETIIEGIQALADGNRINKKTTGRVFRDGEGRTRREEDRPNGTVNISIVDPIAGFSYSLDAASRVAWRTPAPAGGIFFSKLEEARVQERLRTDLEERSVLRSKISGDEEARQVEARKAGSSDEQSKAAADEDKMKAAAAGGRGGGGGRGRGMIARTPMALPAITLERKTLEGIPVEGRKTTTTIPAGQVGNEQPLIITSEEWRSPDLNLLVMTRHADPRTGESTYRLTNIIRAEPDRSLFMVPPDYTVKDTGIRKMLEQEFARKR